MFKRKNPLDWWQTIRQAVWPRMGWWRVLHYYRLRVIRLSNPAHNIAANMACGAAMSFTPFFGIHILGAMAISWMIGAGANVIASTVGTFMGNPWTFPFLLFTSYRVGKWLLDVTGVITPPVDVSPELLEQRGNDIIEKLMAEQSEHESMIQHFMNNTWDIFLPTAVGGTIMALITWPFFYYIFYFIVRGAQRARKLRMSRKQRSTFNQSSKGGSR